MTDIHVGLVGFVNAEQIAQALRVFNGLKKPSDPIRLMVGARTTPDIVMGLKVDNAHQYPEVSVLPSLFNRADYTRALHYTDYSMPSTFDDLNSAIVATNAQVDVLIIDGFWPSVQVVTFLVSYYQALRVVLRLNSAVIKRFHNQPSRLVDRLLQYEGAVSGVVLDLSTDYACVDPLVLQPLICHIREKMSKISMSVGGLDPQNIFLMRNIWRDFRGISIEADSGLRHWGSHGRPIDTERISDFLTNTFAVRYGK